MVLSPLFMILAIVMLGTKTNSIYNAIQRKDTGKVKVQSFILGVMILTIVAVYWFVKFVQNNY